MTDEKKYKSDLVAKIDAVQMHLKVMHDQWKRSSNRRSRKRLSEKKKNKIRTLLKMEEELINEYRKKYID